MGEPSTLSRAQAIEGFAAVLSELRRSVGNPSFRMMAGRSKIISHTTLHEAAQGNRLPSWGTTVEFVKACDADPEDFRERWERANEAVAWCPSTSPTGTSSRPRSAALGTPSRVRVDVPIGPSPAPDATEPADPAGRSRPRRRRHLLLAAAAAVMLTSGIAVAWAVAGHAKPTTPSAPPLVAADCPVHQQNPPPAPPEHAGDRSSFVADLTLPDCEHVAAATTVTKVWRLKNAGTVAWSGYTLHRIDLPQGRDQCQTISDVPIPSTAPGKLVDVKVEITTPGKPGFCFVRFKMVDANGRLAFPGSRPVNFQVIVD